ncbi:MAG: hypothetical protein HYT71_03885 [Candidatus Aenigmarchaeota archaeon]|nr:hypothetical protein [Candidatus Aenigmarchaeota archaeon]
MKINLLLFVQLAVFVVLTNPVSAQLASQSFERINFSEDDLTVAKLEVVQTTFSSPGILPNHPLYFLKRGFENVQVFFEFDKEKKAKLHQEFAKSRLAEAKKLFDDNNTDYARVALEDFDAELNISADLYNSIGNNVSDSTRNREDFAAQSGIALEIMLNKMPEHDKPAIERILDKSFVRKAGSNDIRKNKTEQIDEDTKKKDSEKGKIRPDNSAVHITADSGDEFQSKIIVNENSKTLAREVVGSMDNGMPISTSNVPVVNVGNNDKVDAVKIKAL